jgi:hypothetical protein
LYGKKKRLEHLSTKDPDRHQTLGELISENRLKDIPGEVGVMELVREATKDWEKSLLVCVDRGKKSYLGDFFIVILIKNERLFDEVCRLLFFPRISCPTPTYNQTVYKYTRANEQLEFLWVVPDKLTSQFYLENAIEVESDERDLLNFIIDFYSGELDKKAQILNGENPNQERIILVSP